MTVLKGINYAKGVAVPVQKTDPSEVNSRLKVVTEKYSLAAVLAAADTILGPLLPEGAKVLGAEVYIPQTLGATGIVTMGLEAHVDEDGDTVAESTTSLVPSADAGGAAVLAKATAASAKLYKKVGLGGARVFLTCTELSVVTAGDIYFSVSYSLES